MKNGILIGCHQGLSIKDLKLIHNKIKNFIKNKTCKKLSIQLYAVIITKLIC